MSPGVLEKDPRGPLKGPPGSCKRTPAVFKTKIARSCQDHDQSSNVAKIIEKRQTSPRSLKKRQRSQRSLNIVKSRKNVPSGCLKAVWPDIFGPVFLCFSAESDPRNPPGSPGTAPYVNPREKSAPQTNSKAVSRHVKSPARLPSGIQ